MNTNASLTLSDSVENYARIEIVYAYVNNAPMNSAFYYNGLTGMVDLTAAYIKVGKLYSRTSSVKVNGNTLSVPSDGAGYWRWDSSSSTAWNLGSGVTIYKVIGWKF